MHTNIHITEVPEGEERKKGTESISEDIIAENFPNLGNETSRSRKHRVSQIGSAQRGPHQDTL